ncbi:MAG: OmpA family protein [Myxococcota bacterium]|nr:OmpA family protein [Myxococcota bacterium]
MYMLLFGILATAMAQEPQTDGVDIEFFRAPAADYGYLGMPSATTYQHLQFGVAAWFNYSNDPVTFTENGLRVVPSTITLEGDNGDGIIDNRVASQVQLGLGFTKHFSIAADVPLVLWQDGYRIDGSFSPIESPQPLIGAGVGDVRVQAKIIALDRDVLPIGMALILPVGLPTGNGGSFLGEEGVSLRPAGVLEFSDGSIRKRDYMIRWALMGGYHIRPPQTIRNLTIGNEAVFGTALGFHPQEMLELNVELRGASGFTGIPALEFMGGFQIFPTEFISMNIGFGTGVLTGVGIPDWRAVAGFDVAPIFDPKYRDADRDTIPDASDQCVREPEDFDNFQDKDGCPEYDNDKDSIPDTSDRCPLVAEDIDGFQDQDGCIDEDNDADSILDRSDRCPNEPENVNGYLDDDGCPDEKPVEDTDRDGFLDTVDRCPYDPEDFDLYQDDDGCPDLDNDNDGIFDDQDSCPLEREVFNGVDDEDGCPDEGRVVIEKNNIKITDRIYFDAGLSSIQDRSISLIDEIASVIKSNPHLLKIRVEGHTDSDGSDTRNLKLSQLRADAVMNALIDRGVEANRLDSAGFGEMKPVDTNSTPKGKANNRRVEFIIIEQE